MVPTSGVHTGDLTPLLAQQGTTKLLLVVLDGLGGLPLAPDGQTELEAATTPNLDRLAREGVTGLHHPIEIGMTPGSGAAHLELFGYDSVEYGIERGVLSAIGLGIELNENDLAVRLNFCTLAADGTVTDRRAGRIPTDLNRDLTSELQGIDAPVDSMTFATDRDHRAVLVLRGDGLDSRIRDTDPYQTGVPPAAPEALHPDAFHTSEVLTIIAEQVHERIGHKHPANSVLMRGYGHPRQLPSMESKFKLRSSCLAVFPMYTGVSRAAGMTVIPTLGPLNEQLTALEQAWNDFDFFFVHIKDPDTYGEDGDFDGKVRAIESVDQLLPRALALNPDVLVVTGDHSTPSTLKSHSWHPVPVLLWGQHTRRDTTTSFGETACGGGSLGYFPARRILTLMLAHGCRLAKYGA